LTEEEANQICFKEVFRLGFRARIVEPSQSFFHLTVPILQRILYHNSLLSIAGISGFCQVVPLSTIICFDDFIEIIAEEPEQFNNRSKEGTCKSMLKEVHKNHDYIVIDDGDDDGDDERHSKPLLMKKRTNTEDATRIGSAGVVRRQAVDILPLCRVNQAIYLLTTGAREAAFRNIKTIVECLADELINAAKAMLSRKKDEIERVAKANR
ncbi:hypothetical protein HN51_047914, partial [Arachis hypogaea]